MLCCPLCLKLRVCVDAGSIAEIIVFFFQYTISVRLHAEAQQGSHRQEVEPRVLQGSHRSEGIATAALVTKGPQHMFGPAS